MTKYRAILEKSWLQPCHDIVVHAYSRVSLFQSFLTHALYMYCYLQIVYSSYIRTEEVFAIEFITFAIDFAPFAVEFVTFAVEFILFVIEFIGFALEFVAFLHKNLSKLQ